MEAELHGNTAPQPAQVPQTSNMQAQGSYDAAPQNAAKPTYGKKPAIDAPASPKQIKFLLDLARQNGYSPEQIKAKFTVPAIESMTKTQCSRAIDELNRKAA